MNTFSFLAPFLQDMFKNSSHFSQIIYESKKSFKEEIRETAMGIVARTLFGLVVSAVVIYAIIALGQEIRATLDTMENGQAISMAIFAVLAIAGMIGLYVMFKSKPKIEVEIKTGPKIGEAVQKVVLSFVDGINEGYERTAQKRREMRTAEDLMRTPDDLSVPHSKPYDAASSGF